jgi:L-fuconolactonase
MPDLIDAHLHLWDPAEQPYPWLVEQPALNRRFGPEALDTGGYPLTGVVVVEAGCADRWAEFRWLEQIAGASPVAYRVVAQAPLERGAAVRADIAELARSHFLAGIRRNTQDEPPGFMTTPDFIVGVRGLAEHGLPFDACVREHQLRELVSLVDACPDVVFVLDHLGKPDIRHHRREPWFTDLRELGRRANVFAKLSGLTTEADHHHWQPTDIAPYLRHAIETFGPDRCLFGSDWPVATLATRYQRWVELVLDVVADLRDDERAAVLAGTATSLYHIHP